MDKRYALLGTIILIISTPFLIISLILNLEIVVGISLSTLILGITILVIGMTFREPLVTLYTETISSYSKTLLSLLQDLSLTNADLYGCKSNIDTMVVFSKTKPRCEDISPGIGLSQDNSPYLAIPVNISYEVMPTPEETIIEILRSRDISRSINTYINGNHIVIELIEPRKEIIESPINPIRLLCIASTVYALNTSVRVVNEDIERNVYRIEVEKI